MKLDTALKTSLDELRMQMLGVQVLFGFAFQGLFQSGFDELSRLGRIIDALGLMLILIALAALIAVPCQHRIIEEGEASERIYRTAARFGTFALWPFMLAVACDLFVPLCRVYNAAFAAAISVAALLVAGAVWPGLGWTLRERLSVPREESMEDAKTPLHVKIEQMLTESRVILPGTQALLGFQLVVMMTHSFDRLPPVARAVHVAALLCLALAVMLLIAPAAIHRIGFAGQDDPRLHAVGSLLITLALVPFATGITCDLFVALLKLFDAPRLAVAGAALAFVMLNGLWCLLPLAMRPRVRQRSTG